MGEGKEMEKNKRKQGPVIIERCVMYIRKGRKHAAIWRYRGARGKKLAPWMHDVDIKIAKISKRHDVQITAVIHRDVDFIKSGNIPMSARK